MFWDGLSFGLGVAVAGIVVYLLFILLPDKPVKAKVKNVRYWK